MKKVKKVKSFKKEIMSNNKTTKIKNGLQKFTLSELLEKEEITQGDVVHLSVDEVDSLKKQILERARDTNGSERAKLLKQVDGLLTNNQRNYLYEHNHRLILGHLHNYMLNSGTIPSITTLAEKTELSRTTINKHMREFKTSGIFKEDEQKFEMLAGSVLAIVFKMAMAQDIKAFNLFLYYTKQGLPTNIGTYIDKQQNNFNTFLTPEVISQLSPQQIIDIEAVIINDNK